MTSRKRNRLPSLEEAHERVAESAETPLHGLSGHGLVDEGLPEFPKDHSVSHTHPFRDDPDDDT